MAFSCVAGEIRVQKDNGLDFEVSPQVRLVVLADNGLQTAHCGVSVNLLDVNDNAPVFEHSSYRTAVWEGQSHNTYIMQVSLPHIVCLAEMVSCLFQHLLCDLAGVCFRC